MKCYSFAYDHEDVGKADLRHGTQLHTMRRRRARLGVKETAAPVTVAEALRLPGLSEHEYRTVKEFLRR